MKTARSLNNIIIELGVCNIQNNQGQGKCYYTKLKNEADNTYVYLALDYSRYHKNWI